jgi:alpha-glucosidase (family GH31 glycosyl hydrolase)
MQTLHMPWWYSDATQNHFRFLAWLHTDMLPYWQSLAHEASRTAAPIVRPLVWTWQDDIDTWRIDDQFTVGDALLLAPIVTSEPNRTVYIPEGTWHDFWDDTRAVTGPAKVTWFEGWLRKDRFPLYIRAGAIIPMEIKNAHSTIAWPEAAGYVTLAIWPKQNTAVTFTLHDTEDPVKITADATAKDTLRISWTATARNHLLRVHLSSAPTNIVGIQKSTPIAAFRAPADDAWFYDEPACKLWIRKSGNNTAATVEIQK